MRQSAGASDCMKKILITPRLMEHTDYPEIREAVDVRWGEFCQELGAASYITCLQNFSDAYVNDAETAGIVLSGGNDLSLLNPDDQLSQMRDKFELALIDKAVKRRLPLIGICRGMQILAHYFGTALVKLPGHAGTRHAVSFEKADNCPWLTGLKEVNSYHNWGIRRLPSELQSCMMAADGSIECFRHRHLPVWGQMWHPEREAPFSEIDMTTFKEFFRL